MAIAGITPLESQQLLNSIHSSPGSPFLILNLTPFGAPSGTPIAGTNTLINSSAMKDLDSGTAPSKECSAPT